MTAKNAWAFSSLVWGRIHLWLDLTIFTGNATVHRINHADPFATLLAQWMQRRSDYWALIHFVKVRNTCRTPSNGEKLRLNQSECSHQASKSSQSNGYELFVGEGPLIQTYSIHRVITDEIFLISTYAVEALVRRQWVFATLFSWKTNFHRCSLTW